MKLYFGKGSNNKKLQKTELVIGKEISSFSILAGHTCPGASLCLTKAIKKNGSLTIQKGRQQKFNCYAALMQSRFPKVYELHKHNSKVVAIANRNPGEAIAFLLNNLPISEIIRIHVAGDFASQSYFDVWMEVAKQRKDKIFYAYTKSIPFWLKRKDSIPKNFRLTASYGGKYDSLIEKHGFVFAKVVHSEEEAKKLKLKVDFTDIMAIRARKSFALLLHGPQVKSTKKTQLY